MFICLFIKLYLRSNNSSIYNLKFEIYLFIYMYMCGLRFYLKNIFLSLSMNNINYFISILDYYYIRNEM